MNIKKIINKLKHPPIPISPKDKDIMKEMKRTFIFNRFKYYVDCLYCHAMPGAIEKVLLFLNSLKLSSGSYYFNSKLSKEKIIAKNEN